ncbi:uncharacterized protein LOC142628931 [Castanea sativa]|uniref:uncharacterized protein LOC142628931 n=1 Tax=Castanea sativa TaxID=21020 RepID=UPI003F653E57
MEPQGNWLEELEDVAGVAVQYFNDLFSSSPCTRIDECLEAVPQKVTLDMQQALSCEFTADEIKASLFQMGPTKAPGLEAPTQSAFAPGRLITDNVLVVYEALHTMHGRRNGKTGSLALKLDVSKAYDRVEWNFLRQIMLKLGFPGVWVDRVMSCVSSTSFSILINGKSFEASGQCLNMEKSSVYFSSNTLPKKRESIKALLGVSEVDRFESDLGLPTLVGRRKYHTFSYLKDRVWKKLQGWKGKNLSRARKEILIKAMAQSISMYTIGIFQLPIKLCEELQSMCARYWWGQIGNERKIHWLSWDKLSRPKSEGEMGFKNLRQFNLAMLAKQGCRLMQDQETLVFKCLKARYFPRCHFLEAFDPPNSSYTWKSIMVVKPILQKRSCWRVGNGETIWILKDAWLPNSPTNKVLLPI